jgi:hypothetical protein
MLYLGIDLHAKQITVNLRDEKGDAVLRRQVSTAGDKPALFLAEVALLNGEGGYVAILEVCGFHGRRWVPSIFNSGIAHDPLEGASWRFPVFHRFAAIDRAGESGIPGACLLPSG